MQTYQAHRGVDTVLTAWVRDEDARADLDSADVTVEVFAYGRTLSLKTLEATGTALGKVTATLTAAIADELGPGLYRLDIINDGALIETAKLVIV